MNNTLHSLLRPRRSTLALGLSLALALGLTACGGSSGGPGGGAGAGPGAGGAMPPTPVGVVTLKAAPLTEVRDLPGRVQASVVAEVRPQVSGIVRAMNFTEGGLVKAGQSLYQIEDASLRAARGSAAAQVAKARAALTTAEANAKRADELVAIDAISKQDHDLARAQAAQAQADVRVAEAALTQADVQLAYAQIRAPISGRIGRSAITRGALVSAGQATPLATIQQLDPVHVDVSQSEAEFLALRAQLASGALTGQARDFPVTVLLPDGQPHAHAGKVAFEEATVDPATGARLLRVVVPNPDGVLLPGSYVRARVGTGQRSAAILLPQRAVQRDARGGATVLLVGPGDVVAPQAVKLGPASGDQWLVEAGLKSGDRVIVEGLQKVAPGAKVQPQEAGALAPASAAASAAPTASAASR